MASVDLRIVFEVILHHVLNAAENHDFFKRVAVRQHAHRVIANEIQFVGVERELDLDPHLLVEQEQMDIVKKRSHVLLAQAVVAAARNHDRRVDWQVGHRVAEAGARRLTRRLDGNEFALHYFAVHRYWLEVSQFVHELSITLLTAEVVNAIVDCIALQVSISN